MNWFTKLLSLGHKTMLIKLIIRHLKLIPQKMHHLAPWVDFGCIILERWWEINTEVYFPRNSLNITKLFKVLMVGAIRSLRRHFYRDFSKIRKKCKLRIMTLNSTTLLLSNLIYSMSLRKWMQYHLMQLWYR